MQPVLLTLSEVAAALAVSTRTIERLISRSKFPAPVSLPGVRGSRWRPEVIERYAAGLKTPRRRVRLAVA